jgi:ATP-binding cassette subfamily F protein 3
VWHLDGQHITEYPGTFAEWEAWQAERSAAAAAAAAADTQQRRQAERVDTRRRSERTAGQRVAARALRAAMEKAEARVHELETALNTLRARLEDPALYTSPEGGRRAAELKAELTRVEAELLTALHEWEAASEAMSSAT